MICVYCQRAAVLVSAGKLYDLYGCRSCDRIWTEWKPEWQEILPPQEPERVQ